MNNRYGSYRCAKCGLAVKSGEACVMCEGAAIFDMRAADILTAAISQPDQPRDAEWPKEWADAARDGWFERQIHSSPTAAANSILRRLAAVGALRTPAPATLAEDDRTVADLLKDGGKQEFEKHPALAARIAYLADKMRGISVVTWCEFLAELNAALIKSRQPAPTPQEAAILEATILGTSVTRARGDGTFEHVPYATILKTQAPTREQIAEWYANVWKGYAADEVKYEFADAIMALWEK